MISTAKKVLISKQLRYKYRSSVQPNKLFKLFNFTLQLIYVPTGCG